MNSILVKFKEEIIAQMDLDEAEMREYQEATCEDYDDYGKIIGHNNKIIKDDIAYINYWKGLKKL